MNAQELKKLLAAHFHSPHIEVRDESEKHQKHPEGQGRGGHYHVVIVSDQFLGKTPLERHRMVYAKLSMPGNPDIHALGLKTFTQEEWEKNSESYP